MIKSEDLKSQLKQFSGTYEWFTLPFVKGFLYTEGVKYFAEKAGAYWLITDTALFFGKKVVKTGFATLKAISKDGKVNLILEDEGVKLGSKEYPLSDLPEGEWEFFLQFDGRHLIMMLPSEY